MGRHIPQIAVTEKTAAAMLDMSRQEFQKLVACSALPAPAKIPGEEPRWRVADLERIVSGDAALPSDQDFEI